MSLPFFLMPDMIIARWLQENVVVHPTVEWQGISLFLLMLKPIIFMITNSGNLFILNSTVYARQYILRSKQNGKCGITLNTGWSHPEDPTNALDVLASEIAMSMYLGWWAYPIYGEDGDYAEVMKETLKNANEWDKAWEFTEEEKKKNKGASDFFGTEIYL